MVKMLDDLRDRMKGRVGIYGTGWNPESVMGLLLPFLLVGAMALIGWMFVSVLNG
jgi:hypothetical protein